MRINLILLNFIFLNFLFISSCKKEEKETTPVTQADVVTSFTVSFYNTVDSTVLYCSYVDADGKGPSLPVISGTALKTNCLFEVSVRLKDELKSPATDLYQKLKSDGKNYKVCIDNSLGLVFTPTDSDGNLPIGFESTVATGNTPDFTNLHFTIRHQAGTKNGSCTPGVEYFSCSIPVSIVN